MHLIERAEDVAHRGRRGHLDRRVPHPETGGAQADLIDRFLAADVRHLRPGARQRGRRLEHERGLADARIAADQDRRAVDQTAAEHAIELGDRGGQTRRSGRGARQPDQLEPLRRARAHALGHRRRRALRGERVPLAAGVAAPGPFGVNRAAALADVLCVGSGHEALAAAHRRDRTARRPIEHCARCLTATRTIAQHCPPLPSEMCEARAGGSGTGGTLPAPQPPPLTASAITPRDAPDRRPRRSRARRGRRRASSGRTGSPQGRRRGSPCGAP